MKEYSSTIISKGLLYDEMKKASELALNGFAPVHIKEKIIYENLFSYESEKRKAEVGRAISDRVSVLNFFLLDKIVNGDLNTSKSIVLYTVIETDRLFCEFIKEVYQKKYINKDRIITDEDFNDFFQKKRKESKKVASWKYSTTKKLIQVYKRMLIEAGFAKRKGKSIVLTIPKIDEKVIKVIKDDNIQIYISEDIYT